MGENKGSSKILPITLGIICIILALVIVLMFFNVIPISSSTREAKLINVGLGARDLGRETAERTLRIEGYVCNVGTETAYKTRIHVVADYVTGGNAIDSYINIGIGGVIYGEDSVSVESDISYSAYADLGSWTITPVWSGTP